MKLFYSLKSTLRLFPFFFVHSVRDMGRNRSRTIFALVCVAAGVAAVVALRSLAFMIGDELTQNLAEINRGDIRLFASTGVPGVADLSEEGDTVFTREALDAVRRWAAREGVEVTAARLPSGMGFAGGAPVRKMVEGEVAATDTAATLYIEPGAYPFYDTILLSEPNGARLAEVMPEEGAGLPLVVSSNLAARLDLQIGNSVRLGAEETPYTVQGIVPSDSETILTIPSLFLFKYHYVYLPLGDKLPNQLFVKVPLGRDIGAVEKSLIAYLQDEIETDVDLDEELNRISVPELERQNEETADLIGDLILAMGLSSLLIGGIGIINTMLVVVSRRTVEIAVLKTLGLKGYRVTLLFLIEAAMMGLIGSILGVAIGVVLSYGIKSVGEEALTMGLTWRLYPRAMLDGLFLGMIITVLFGFLPTLIAGQVRPAVVLRPNEAQMPAAGLLQTLATLVVMIVVLGLLVNAIVEGAVSISPIYMMIGAGALVGLFAGVITANTRLGKPLPDYYEFRLSRRFERLDGWIVGAVGLAAGRARARRVITAGVRGLRQLVLLYGALAIGAALASAIVLVLSELWLPFGWGKVKPAGHVIAAWERGDWAWVGVWLALMALIGGLIRWRARALGGVIALSSLGITLGGAAGWLAGRVMERVLAGTPTWDMLSELSTGVVLVEAALALLGVVYVGYWLLVWVVGKMPALALLMVVSLTIVGLLVSAAYALLMVSSAAVLAVGLALLWGWIGLRLRWIRRAAPVERTSAPSTPLVRVHSTPAILLSVAALLLVYGLSRGVQIGLILAGFAVLFLGVLIRLLRYRVDARLVLREMTGRRTRVASTLLGLSVGIAGLSIVSLTTSAVSRLLEMQITDSAEGNLLIMLPLAQQRDAVKAVLDEQEGIERYSQFVTYSAVLLEINGKEVQPFHDPEMPEQSDADENSNFERNERGVRIMLSERESLADLPAYKMVSGERLAPEDAGKLKIMVRQSFYTEELGIDSGDVLLFGFENGPGTADDVMVRLTVSGIIERSSEQSGFGDSFLVPPGTLTGRPEGVRPRPFNIITIVQVDDSERRYMDETLAAVADIPGVIPVEISAITQLIRNLLDRLKAIPQLVAWLALVAGGAIIANTVALATQERRRQIGIMKAIGLKGQRVLGMLMIENGLIGLIAGIIGSVVGLGITVVIVLAAQSPEELKTLIHIPTILWLLVMSIGVAVGAATLSARSAAAEKPMNVLRYE